MGGAGIDGDEQIGAIENLCEVDERSFAAKILDDARSLGAPTIKNAASNSARRDLTIVAK